jgi:hypothetical protein
VAPEFVPGLQLARGFYATVVRPLLEEQFSQLPYAAALLGPGSEVAGFDSPRSTDHDWGPRLQVFLADGDADRHATALTAMLASRLPGSFRGYPVAFPVTRDSGGTAIRDTPSRCWTGWPPRRSDWRSSPRERSFTTSPAS